MTITLTREEAQQVLDALERGCSQIVGVLVQQDQDEAIETLRARLAQPEPEPVAWVHKYGCRANAFGQCNMGCTAPPQREWVGLTHEEKMEILTRSITAPSRIDVAEAMLKEKNT